MKKKAILITVVVLVALAGGIFGFVKIKQKNEQSKQMQVPVEYTTVTKQRITNTVDASGNVSFKNTVSVYAKNNGKVQSVVAPEGTNVNKGDVIINYDKNALENLKRQLNDAKLALKSSKLALEALYIPADESQIIQQKSQITQNEKSILDIKNNIADLDQNIIKAKVDVENANTLYNQGAISLSELNNFKTALENFEKQKRSAETNLLASEQQLQSSKAQLDVLQNKVNEPSNKNRIESQKVLVEQAQSKVNQLQNDINKFEISTLSPVNGTITKVNVKEGEPVTEDKVIAEMGDLNDMIIEAYIPEFDMYDVREGQSVKIKSDNLLEDIDGTVAKIFPVAEKKTSGTSEKTVVKVNIAVSDTSVLKAGYSVKLVITTRVDENALVVPTNSYMTESNQDPYVFVIRDDNTLEKRRIKIKGFDDNLISVVGLNEGEAVVSSPDEKLAEGMKVTKVDEQGQMGQPTDDETQMASEEESM